MKPRYRISFITWSEYYDRLKLSGLLPGHFHDKHFIKKLKPGLYQFITKIDNNGK